jgi:hypothetical protein
MRATDRRLTPRATVTAANALIARALWPPVFGSTVLAAGDGITIEPSTLGLRGTVVAGAVVGAIGCGLDVGVEEGVVVGFVTFVAPDGGAVVVLVVVVLLVVVVVVGVVVSTTPPQSAGRLTVMVRETEPPPGTASMMITVNDTSDIGRPVAVPSMFPCAKEPTTCPTVMLDNVMPFETVSPVTVAGPG